jgi:uncharacterized protein (DUF488 family)
MSTSVKEIWTIGHSTRSLEEFIRLLKGFSIKMVVDIRTFPGSRKYPHFNKEFLMHALNDVDIAYVHMVELGGRRKPNPDSTNTVWRNASFRGYADYMQTAAFEQAIVELEKLASTNRLAYMCSEAVWWRCHRSLVSDYLKVRGWTVKHIMDIDKVTEHPYTSPAQAVQGKLFY